MPFKPHRFGRYILLRPLGSGGMAEIFLGVTQGPAGFRKSFAVKCLHPHLSRQTKLIELFLDEARTAAKLSHANIVQTYELGQESGIHYIAMEFVHGITLAQLLTTGPVDLDVALPLMIGAGQGLAFAHTARDEQRKPLSIIHRDVTPRNILISFGGEVKLADFGIARAADQLHTTQTGESKGTLRYMSPEQLAGGTLDQRADIYSFGVCLHEALTGRRLFGKISNTKLHDPDIRKNLPGPSAVRPELPTAVDAIVAKALAPDADDRFDTMDELVEELGRFCDAHKVSRGRDATAATLLKRFPTKSVQPMISHEESEILLAGNKLPSKTVPASMYPIASLPSGEATIAQPHAAHRTGPLPEGRTRRLTGPPEASHTYAGPMTGPHAPTPGSIQTVSSLPPVIDTGHTAPGPSQPPHKASQRTLVIVAVVLIALSALVILATQLSKTVPATQKTTGATDGKVGPRAIVKLRFVSKPSGAMVLLDGVDVGRTPLATKHARNTERQLRVELRLPNHESERRQIDLEKDHTLVVVLTPKATPKRSIKPVDARKHKARRGQPRRQPKATRKPPPAKPAAVATVPKPAPKTKPSAIPPTTKLKPRVKLKPRAKPKPDPVKVDDLK